MSDYPPNLKLRPIDAWPRAMTKNRERSRFSAPWRSTLEMLNRELRHLGGGREYAPAVLQIALREGEFRNDGMPYARAVPAHPGVILSVLESVLRGPITLPCDKYVDWRDNMRAIAMGLESLRVFDRHGLSPDDEQYRGWQALEAAPSVDVKGAACALLARVAWPNENDGHQAGWAPKVATDPEIGRRTFRKALANAHPDRNGGEQSLYDEVQQAGRVLGLSTAIASR